MIAEKCQRLSDDIMLYFPDSGANSETPANRQGFYA